MLRLGLTGGIGSGKSTVAALLAEFGAGVIDADAISRNATDTNGAAIEAIAVEFGADFISSEGALNRVRMRNLVFRDASAKARLEHIVHPIVSQQVQESAGALNAAGKNCVVFDIPLLVESGRWRKQLDRVLVVDCSPATQIARVVKRSEISAQEVERIIAMQASRFRRLSAADWVLHNDGISMNALVQQVRQIATQFGL
jgi:dephospho-CoA kinase